MVAARPARTQDQPADDRARTKGSGRRLTRPPRLVEEIVALIRSDIMALRIPPNTRISIDALVRDLGVSQTPIREALSMLEATGLVTKRHFAGYWSAPQLDDRQLRELYDVRLLFEPFAARRAAEHLDEAALAKIVALAKAMTPAATETSYALFADQDAELHDLIAAAADNQIIRETLTKLHSHLHIFRMKFKEEVTREAEAEHRALLDALTRRDPDAAEAAMRDHILQSYRRMTS